MAEFHLLMYAWLKKYYRDFCYVENTGYVIWIVDSHYIKFKLGRWYGVEFGTCS